MCKVWVQCRGWEAGGLAMHGRMDLLGMKDWSAAASGMGAGVASREREREREHARAHAADQDVLHAVETSMSVAVLGIAVWALPTYMKKQCAIPHTTLALLLWLSFLFTFGTGEGAEGGGTEVAVGKGNGWWKGDALERGRRVGWRMLMGLTWLCSTWATVAQLRT